MQGTGACVEGGHAWLGVMCGGAACMAGGSVRVNERSVRILLECILVRIRVQVSPRDQVKCETHFDDSVRSDGSKTVHEVVFKNESISRIDFSLMDSFSDSTS